MGSVKLEDDGRSAAVFGRGGYLDMGTRPGFAVTDGLLVDCWVKPSGGGHPVALGSPADGPRGEVLHPQREVGPPGEQVVDVLRLVARHQCEQDAVLAPSRREIAAFSSRDSIGLVR